MKANSKMVLFAAAAISLLGFGAVAQAESARAIRREIRSDRAELRRDYAELRRDRVDLYRLRRSGASRAEIVRKQREVKDGFREVAQGRREIRQGYADLRANRPGNSHGWRNDSRFGRHDRWNRSDYRGRGWDNRRWASRDRWGWGRGRN